MRQNYTITHIYNTTQQETLIAVDITLIKLLRREHRLTVLAVDSIEARLALADVLAEDVTTAGLACHLADGIIFARVGVARPFWTKRKSQKRKERRDKFNKA